MNSAESFEKIAVAIAGLNENEIKRKILNFRGRFRMDFTEEYLESLPIDRLRHILLAAMTTKLKKRH